MAASHDYQYMARALQLARRGLYTTDPNPRVGCVLVNGGDVVGEGWHERAGEPHAEIHALGQAGERARGATAYVTLEPCAHHGRTPPCVNALVDAGVARVVTTMEDPNALVAGSGNKYLREQGIQVDCGIMAHEAVALNPGFIKRMKTGLPYVRCKMGASLDGRSAMASGESKWITGPDARQDVQRLRARSSAVMTGIGTVLADDPSLNVRAGDIGEPEPAGGWRQPLRVIVDPRLSTPVDARILAQPGETLIATTADDEDIMEILTKAGAQVIRFPGSPDHVDLPAVLRHLAKLEVNEVLLETGAILSGAMVCAGLVDELVVYMAPVLMGDKARGLFRTPEMDRMEDSIRLDITDLRAVGDDWRITAIPVNRDPR
ncbi:MAG: bifunctional diaminohydroxyphosphoribosylaminopyrimidine deaminase/5-amino-6-(5-phosphoribosylamino)uracil reductase RibD [Gammaproteobacteria bacterium]|nr:bifunctional diaminohydroxyphosphoribosylaminopyrimidine deaminase/5-amino-6-(5-phosphoribosylamino)uracil reductase RibD [Gammaproteobacteria bacterium]